MLGFGGRHPYTHGDSYIPSTSHAPLIGSFLPPFCRGGKRNKPEAMPVLRSRPEWSVLGFQNILWAFTSSCGHLLWQCPLRQ